MNTSDSNAVLALMFPTIESRLKEAHSVASAAFACASAGNYEGAFRILLDIEELTNDAITLLNAASIMRREAET